MLATRCCAHETTCKRLRYEMSDVEGLQGRALMEDNCCNMQCLYAHDCCIAENIVLCSMRCIAGQLVRLQ